jgi:hypothetical protein
MSEILIGFTRIALNMTITPALFGYHPAAVFIDDIDQLEMT